MLKAYYALRFRRSDDSECDEGDLSGFVYIKAYGQAWREAVWFGEGIFKPAQCIGYFVFGSEGF